MNLDNEVEAALQKRQGRRVGAEIKFACPAHDDSNPSAEWNRAKHAWNCPVCGAGGTTRDLATLLGIGLPAPAKAAFEDRIVATYDYRDADGTLLYQVVRLANPKEFRQRIPRGREWEWKGPGSFVLYRLPELPPEGRVYIVEGEKDADNLALAGAAATTWAGGASRRWLPEYSAALRGRECVLLPDNDVPGQKAMAAVAAGLSAAGVAVRIVTIPNLPPKGDITDFLIEGGSLSELEELADAAPPFDAPAEEGGISAFPLTDAGNGEVFAYLHGAKVRYDHAQGRWLVWDRHRWAPDRDGAIQRLAKVTARARAKAAADLYGEQATKAFGWAKASEAAARMEAMIKLARTEEPIADRGLAWDENSALLGCENGVLNLATSEFRPGRMEDRITMTTGIAYDPVAKAPRWERFLEEVFLGDAEMVAFIRRAVGYSLVGQGEQTWFLCHGSGGNGKSVFVETLAKVLGDYWGDLPAKELQKEGGMENRDAASPYIAGLKGKRFITCSETGAAWTMNDARIKKLTDGHPMQARMLHSNPITFQVNIALWLTTNKMPRVEDDTDGYWRRVKFVPFLAKFPEGQRETDLEKTLEAELPGILAWAVRGAAEWRTAGLRAPESVLLATKNYREQSDPLGEFITECCVVADWERATRAQLLAEYREWGKRQGYLERDLLGSRTFGAKIGERWPNEMAHGVRSYRGIGLKNGRYATREGHSEPTGSVTNPSPHSFLASKGGHVELSGNTSPTLPALPIDSGPEDPPFAPCCSACEGNCTEGYQSPDGGIHCELHHPWEG